MENNSCRQRAADRYREALATFHKGATWDGLKSLTFWGAAADMSADDVITDARARGVTSRDADIRRGMATAGAKVAAWNAAHGGRGARYVCRHKPTVKPPPPSRTVEDCVDKGRRERCTSSIALKSLSPVDVRHMDAEEQRQAQLAAMFDHPHLRTLPVGIMPHSGAWVPHVGYDFMPVTEWLADGTRLARAGELVKVNPFTGKSEEREDGKPHLATVATVATFPHVLMEFDQMPLPDQCAFWYGAITLCRLPVVALVYSGGKSVHGVVRVDCASHTEFDKAVNLVRRAFATSPNPSMRLDVQSLALPIVGARFAGCVRADTGRVQRLLYLSCPSEVDRPQADEQTIHEHDTTPNLKLPPANREPHP